MPDPSQPLLAELNDAAERIWQACSPQWPQLSLEVLPEVGSTNTELMERGRRGETWPTALVAVRQNAGRGRRGRDWLATPGATLTFSIGLPVQLDGVPGGGSALSLAVGLSLAQALDAGLQQRHAAGLGPSHPPIGLKWPNDLWLGTRKLGGVLIEATPAPGLPEGTRWVVVGVGLNVHPGNAPAGAAWLEGAPAGRTQAPLQTAEVWAWLVPALLADIRRFEATGFAPLQRTWATRDVLLGQRVALWTRTGVTPDSGAPADALGQAQGVDEAGALLVHTDQGLQRWGTGDVSVRMPGPTDSP
nr:biotin--[acetyl-CoA-carboxylase] ligase [uncultured Aquabacterium sp.]